MCSGIKRLMISIFVVFMTMPFAFATQYEYDSLNRLSKVTYGNNVQIAYTYDNSGNQTVRVISLPPDITRDGAVDTLDLMDLTDVWLNQPCVHPDWCGAADLDLNGKVDLSDFALLGERWLEGTVAVPNVVGMSQTEAQAAIVAQDLTVGAVSGVYSDTVAAGYVITQYPLAGVFLRPGANVDLVISQGPEPLLMPNLIGLPLTEAEAVIRNEGLIVGGIY